MFQLPGLCPEADALPLHWEPHSGCHVICGASIVGYSFEFCSLLEVMFALINKLVHSHDDFNFFRMRSMDPVQSDLRLLG